MNISFCNKDEVRGTLKMEIGKVDYIEKVEKSLRNLRMKAIIPGFRKGMVPMGIVQKKFGKQVLGEELYDIVSDALDDYFDSNPQLKIFGQPVSNFEQTKLDFDTQEDFDLFFDVAFIPEIDIELSKDDVLPYYRVIVSNDLVDEEIADYQMHVGSYEEVTEVSKDDIVKGTMTELENGLPKEGGIIVENATLLPMYIKDTAEESKIIGAQKGATIVFNPRKAYEGSTSPDSEIASLLAKAQEEVAGLESDFSFEIKSITQYKEAELGQPFFDKIFGEGSVSNEDEFRAKVKELLIRRFEAPSDYRFFSDLRPYLLGKAGDLPMADDILKRHLRSGDRSITEEELETMYPAAAESIKFNLVMEHILQKNNISIDVKDLTLMAERETKASFARYGIQGISEEVINNYALNTLKDKAQTDNLRFHAKKEKLLNFAKETVTLDIKEVSLDDFNDFFQSNTSEEME